MTSGMGHKALRKGRISIPGQIYLITFVSWRRRKIFGDFESACIVASTLSKSSAWASATVLGWCLMPDHWHGLVQLSEGTHLSRCVNAAKSKSAINLNRALDRNGQVWGRGFHDRALRKQDDLLSAARYVVANPLRAGLVASLRQYPFWDAVWL